MAENSALETLDDPSYDAKREKENLHNDLYVRTQYDGRDLMSIEEIYFYDEDGDEQTHTRATNACIEITTCADQGYDLWSWLRAQVEETLRWLDIPYQDLIFEDDRGNLPRGRQ